MRFNMLNYAFMIALVVLISGCSWPQKSLQKKILNEPMDTPAPLPGDAQPTQVGPLCKTDKSHVLLPDGSEIYLVPDTELEILSLEGLTSDTSGHELLLRQGQIVIVSKLPPGTWFTIINPDGSRARLDGLMMQVGFDPDPGVFSVICIDGVCELGSDTQEYISVGPASEAWIAENGDFRGPFVIDLNQLREGCGDDYIAVTVLPSPTPSLTPDLSLTPAFTLTPDLNATATAFCGEFEAENPGTPCP